MNLKVQVDNGSHLCVKGLIHRRAVYQESFPIRNKFFSVSVTASKEIPFGSANYRVKAFATSPLLSDDPKVRCLDEPNQFPSPREDFEIKGPLQTVVTRLIDRGNNELVDKLLQVAAAIRDRVSPVGKTVPCF